ncbi:MAG: hypothetical protein ABSE22_22700 [Xanthobacteraceae bacterium]|jgi:hypothetical protein
MTTITLASDYGTPCVKCGDLLLSPEWSEFEDDEHVLNLWSCEKCGCQFETKAAMPPIGEAVIRAFFSSLLVA